jgi:hypothetical protein
VNFSVRSADKRQANLEKRSLRAGSVYAAGVFYAGRGRKTEQEVFEQREQRLERKMGHLVEEVDWFSKKCKELGIDP